MLTDVDGSMC